MLNRREFIKAGALAAVWPWNCPAADPTASGSVVNDIHSQLNPTRVAQIVRPDSIQALQELVRTSRRNGRPISIAGSRHAMGGQQFATAATLADMRAMNRVLGFDRERGIVEVEAGVEWPELISYLLREQAGRPRQWGIIQKQTGADRLSIGGALAANVHGRGLNFKPIVADVESFTLVDAAGEVRRCSRSDNADLFRLAIGGYGLFGMIATVKLRLAPRTKLERVVEVIEVKELMAAFEQRIAKGFTYGDFQYATDLGSEDFLRRGVFSCYRPVGAGTPIAEAQKELAEEDWKRLYQLAHRDRKRAFEEYARYYLSTSGQIYWSDTHQLSVYIGNYHRALDRLPGGREKATEIITEIYVPRSALTGFLDECRADFRRNNVDVIYGTIRLIEKDEESFLAWARERYVCVIFNLHTRHSSEGIAHSARAFRHLIDLALTRGGSYYLTYHKYATRKQVEGCYPQFREFLRLKKKYDQQERFQSDWFRHYKKLLA